MNYDIAYVNVIFMTISIIILVLLTDLNNCISIINNLTYRCIALINSTNLFCFRVINIV